jgi:hypothetical protein
MGLLIYGLSKLNIQGSSLQRVYLFFALACIPTYFLSVLWWSIPAWLYIVVVIAAVFQVAGWIILLMLSKRNFQEIVKYTRFHDSVFCCHCVRLNRSRQVPLYLHLSNRGFTAPIVVYISILSFRYYNDFYYLFSRIPDNNENRYTGQAFLFYCDSFE